MKPFLAKAVCIPKIWILKIFTSVVSFWFLFAVSGCSQTSDAGGVLNLKSDNKEMVSDTSATEIATLGAGCFWCVEAVFQRLEGVVSVESGYSGGDVKNPGYKEVCAGLTGHAEVARITFKPSVISFEEILEVFFISHDPTQINRQGNDVGTQYRSAIFTHSDEQLAIATKAVAAANESGLWPEPLATEVGPIKNYYKAEDYHQNYYNDNTRQPYCSFVITPKVEKVKKLFKDKLKEEYK